MHGLRRFVGLSFVTAFLVLGTGACTTYRDELARSQRAFELEDHPRTLALLRDLEPDVKRLTAPEQAEYAYLRGMTDYRLGFRSDARHWLAVAKATDDHSPGMLPADWKARTTGTLDELNGVVYEDGTAALMKVKLPAAEPAAPSSTVRRPAPRGGKGADAPPSPKGGNGDSEPAPKPDAK